MEGTAVGFNTRPGCLFLVSRSLAGCQKLEGVLLVQQHAGPSEPYGVPAAETRGIQRQR